MAESKQKMELREQQSLDMEENEEMMPPPLDDVMNLVVFLRDRTGLHFTLEDAPLTRCDSLLSLVLQEQGLPPEAHDVFSLWLVSPILELRLKSHHNPFLVVQRWDQLCAKYTDSSNEDIHDSEPVMMMQRDVFFRKDQEQHGGTVWNKMWNLVLHFGMARCIRQLILIHNEQILCLLYHEAKYNVIEERYVLHDEDYHYLAGIQGLIHLGSYDPHQHVLADYRANLVKFYPEHMYAQNRFAMFTKRDKPAQLPCEERFMDAHQKASEELQHIASKDSLVDLYMKYLQVLWSYPFYGGAFFTGIVEAKVSRLRRFILPNPDLRVRVCINSDSLSLFNKRKPEYLMSVPFSQMSWQYQDLEWDGDSDPPPTLLVQFICDERSEDAPAEQITKLLQIYSREALLMDALVDTCVKRKLQLLKTNPGIDFVDAGVMDSAERRILNKLEKLSLETYTKDGEQLDTA